MPFSRFASPSPAAIRHGFGRGQSGAALLRGGWSAPEDGHCWSVGPSAWLEVVVPPGGGDPWLLLALRPFVAPPTLPAQRIRITVGGEAQPEEVLWSGACVAFMPDRARWGAGSRLPITFDLPDCTSPAAQGVGDDPRVLGVALESLTIGRMAPGGKVGGKVARQVRPPLPLVDFDGGAGAQAMLRGVTGLDARALLVGFESLGHNCEFGLLQRRFEAEPLGLLRFASIRPDALIAALDADFAGVADPDQLVLMAEGAPRLEYMVRHRRYGMHAHTFRYPDEDDAARTLREQARKLGFQHRRFREVLAGGGLFVFHDWHRMSVAQARAILLALRRHGPNALLAVSEDDERPSGSVALIERDLYLGHVAKFAPIAMADRADATAWISVCANAYRLWREQGFGGDG